MRSMELAMAGLARDETRIYVDNIIVFLKTLEEHIVRLERVLRKRAEAN
jgi:hypothetical protein